jgi:hypothetical protein
VTFRPEELRKLAVPLLACVALLACGVVLIRLAGSSLHRANQALAATKLERNQNVTRLARIAEEEREVKAKMDVYHQLKQLRVLGEERRLEWADALARIRTERELLDLRYRVERQQLLTAVPGKPAGVDFFASTMHVNLALLHEQDLLRFLADLRASGNAYYSVKKCLVARTGPTATGATATGATLIPRLHADCSIDLITIIDRAAKS